MMTSEALPTPPAASGKRPYVTPTLITHGSARTLTQAKTGQSADNDNAGSFTQGLSDDEPAGG